MLPKQVAATETLQHLTMVHIRPILEHIRSILFQLSQGGHMRKHISFTATAVFLAVAMIVCIKSTVLATNAGVVRPPAGLSWPIPGSSSYLPIHTLEEVY